MSTPPVIYAREIPEYRLDGLPLGRHVEHDDRSHSFAFQAPAGSAAGQLQPVRHQRFVPVLDQGPRLGSCTGNAGLGAAGTGPVFQAIPATVQTRPDTTDAVRAEAQAVVVYSVRRRAGANAHAARPRGAVGRGTSGHRAHGTLAPSQLDLGTGGVVM